MPWAQIHLLIGRTSEQKQALIQRVTDAIAETLKTPRDTVRVVLDEISPEHWAVGGRTIAQRQLDGRLPPTAEDIDS